MKKITIIFLLIIITFTFAFGTEALALSLTNKVTGIGTAAGFENTQPNLAQQVGQIIQGLLSLLGVIFLILIIYAGYLWMLARGNEELVTKAKAIIKGGILGLIIILAAYAITAFVVTNVAKSANYGSGASSGPNPIMEADCPDGLPAC